MADVDCAFQQLLEMAGSEYPDASVTRVGDSHVLVTYPGEEPIWLKFDGVG